MEIKAHCGKCGAPVAVCDVCGKEDRPPYHHDSGEYRKPELWDYIEIRDDSLFVCGECLEGAYKALEEWKAKRLAEIDGS